MIELVQLEKAHAKFARRGIRVAAISNDKLEDARQTQADFPNLLIVSDADQNLAKAVQVVHAGVDPHGGDTNAPTTFLVDGAGTVRWWFRPERFVQRLSPESLLRAADDSLKNR